MELPWYYLADIAVVLYGHKGAECDPKIDDERRAGFAAVEKQGPGPRPPAAIRYVVETVREAVESKARRSDHLWYTWWPDLEVKVRRLPPNLDLGKGNPLGERDFFLGPDQLVLPWPFLDVEDSEANRKLFSVEDFDAAFDFDPATNVLADPFLKAGDDIVTADDEDRRLKPGENAKRKLVRRVRQGNPNRRGYALPPNTRVDPKPIPTELTRVDLSGDGVRLVLGTVLAVPDRPGPAVEFTDYPCGLYC